MISAAYAVILLAQEHLQLLEDLRFGLCSGGHQGVDTTCDGRDKQHLSSFQLHRAETHRRWQFTQIIMRNHLDFVGCATRKSLIPQIGRGARNLQVGIG